MDSITIDNENGKQTFEYDSELDCITIIEDENGVAQLIAKRCDNCGECEYLPCDYCETHACMDTDECPYGN